MDIPLQMYIPLNPERVAPVGRNRVAVESAINSVTQGSRNGNPGRWDQTPLR
jgi:hypothetical protein